MHFLRIQVLLTASQSLRRNTIISLVEHFSLSYVLFLLQMNYVYRISILKNWNLSQDRSIFINLVFRDYKKL